MNAKKNDSKKPDEQPDLNVLLDREEGRENAIFAAMRAMGVEPDQPAEPFEAMAAALDKWEGMPPDGLFRVSLEAQGIEPAKITHADNPEAWRLITAFKATYLALTENAVAEANMIKARDHVEEAPDPLAAEYAQLNRIKRRERLARSTPYERKLRARRKAAEKAFAAKKRAAKKRGGKKKT